METSGLGGGMYSGMGSGMLGLEMPLHQNPPNAHNATSLQHPQVVGYDPHHPQTQQMKPAGYPYSSSKPKQQLTLSDEDEPGFNPDENSGGDPKRNGTNNNNSSSSNKSSPWQRMKWTDTMVRLLIMAVFYIGDEGGLETNDPKKKSGGLLQKKGKWKSVSRAMMEKGYYVSPQQCEDKFNDLNKRYKRVNDILGKGTACKVVENQGLLETMDLSPKMKEEVKKLLNSKHLFFREMCAYHTSCGHGVAAGGGVQNSSEQPQPPNEQPQQRCLHGAAESHPPLGEKEISGKAEADSSKVVGRGGSGEEYDDDDDDDDDLDDDEDDFDDDEEHEDHEHDNDARNLNHPRKRPRRLSYSPSPAVMQHLNGEVMGVIQDAGKSPWEKKQWVKGKMLQLEELQVRYRGEAYELERQRLKWVKFSGKKEREMEMAKLENERRLLENERMVLLLRQKELELVDPQPHQQQNSSNKREPSSITG